MKYLSVGHQFYVWRGKVVEDSITGTDPPLYIIII